MRICFIGDVVAAPGRRVIKNILPNFLASNNIDFCVVNAENSARGLGVSSRINEELFKCGVDVITLGNHTFSFHDFIYQADKDKRVIRPANVSPDWPGFDYAISEKNGKKLGVINLIGQVDITPVGENPFTNADRLVEIVKNEGADAVMIDFHAEATSEKIAFGYYMDGKASLVVGTHSHVQTADNRILPNGTGYITDAGMTGCVESVLGMDIEASLRRLKDKLPAKYEPAEGDAMMSGVIAEIDNIGRCISIKRFNEYE